MFVRHVHFLPNIILLICTLPLFFLSTASELDQLEIINYMHRALSDQKDYVLDKLCNQSHRLLHE